MNNQTTKPAYFEKLTAKVGNKTGLSTRPKHLASHGEAGARHRLDRRQSAP